MTIDSFSNIICFWNSRKDLKSFLVPKYHRYLHVRLIIVHITICTFRTFFGTLKKKIHEIDMFDFFHKFVSLCELLVLGATLPRYISDLSSARHEFQQSSQTLH